MANKHRIISAEQLAIAAKNGIPESTVRHRLRRSWELERAITEVPQKRPLNSMPRSDVGTVVSQSAIEKGKAIAFRLPKDLEIDFEALVKDSSSSRSEILIEIIQKWVDEKKSLPKN